MSLVMGTMFPAVGRRKWPPFLGLHNWAALTADHTQVPSEGSTLPFVPLWPHRSQALGKSPEL